MRSHRDRVQELQAQIAALNAQKALSKDFASVSLRYGGRNSFTFRSKAYKQGLPSLDCTDLDHILEIDTHKRLVRVEPRVTMEQLVDATFPLGLCPPVIPEIKTMTIGGAIMGIAGESSSHRWGSFNDCCAAFEFLDGRGDLWRASPFENADLFYGLPGSYGSLGMLVSAEVSLVPVEKLVHLHYHVFTKPSVALEALSSLLHCSHPPDFLEGFVFSDSLAVIVSGNMCADGAATKWIQHYFCNSANTDWYYQHAYQIALQGKDYQELMVYPEYLFRHDQGAFWMGAYLCHGSFLKSFFGQGILKLSQGSPSGFSHDKLQRYRNVYAPSRFWQTLLRPIMDCKTLSNLVHRAGSWIHNRFVIQDFCLSEGMAAQFLNEVIGDPAIFPIWLCPIKSCDAGQVFAPHLRGQDANKFVINIGLYGLPSYSGPVEEITRKLEHRVQQLKGRKVLYSRSYYTKEEFWQIYSREAYECLRQKTAAQGCWHEITDKVLSA